jgi:phospholipid/cholesterol/gamma-HCH transport system substrate-binding protein
MHLTRRIKIQLAMFAFIALIAVLVMGLGYMKLPALWFGIGRYTVNVDLPRAGGLYKGGNVTYRGTEVGRITDVHLSDTGAVAVLSLDSDVRIPSNLQAEVHSVSAIGELYVALLPRDGASAPLKNGDTIPLSQVKVPPDINSLLDAANRGLKAIPQDNLKSAIDEAYVAFGGLGPDLSRFVKGSTQLAIDARANLDQLTTLIDQSQPVLDSQSDTSDAIKAWSANLATVTAQLKDQDDAVAGLIDKSGPTNPEATALVERLKLSLPVLMSNLVSVGEVAVTYQPSIEQLLVLLPVGTSAMQAGTIANQNTKQAYKGQFLDFNLNLNLPPPCTTGFLPAQQQRTANFEDAPDRPAGDLYCRIPQDSTITAVRGARNYPCETVPGKRAPTVKMCESDEQYVPLNDGWNWKGDPNATLSGQPIPQPPPGTPTAPAPPPIAAAEYNPATGTYVGPDGQVYTQSNLAETAHDQTWQSMLVPPTVP